jgi:hypothetical protein
MLSFSDSLTSLAPALAAVQAEVEHATKGKVNPAFKSKYADVTEVLDTIKPVLEKHGFSAPQFPGIREGAEGLIVTLETLLLHKSGEWIRSEAATPLERVSAQGVGSAITYLRRYALTSIIGLGQEDDDGASASAPRRERDEYRAGRDVTDQVIKAPTAREMRDLLTIAAEQAGVTREDILAFDDDPFRWLREHQYAYATLVAAARSARDNKVEQDPLVTP